MSANDPTALPPVSNPSRVDVWEASEGTTFRYFEGELRGQAVPLRITGFQHADGTVHEPKIAIDADEPFDVDAALELIESLTAAVADLRRLGA
ncbi:hypothetical protein [Mycolicibacterium fortuitum]|uniref:hypothetical protein n=1 Tax=Mycolicibacterium fortuitum TaxID=1766 RepID=UPI0009452205|nr:hypothetical protein [Mycolicibacterium fortuitum]